jgi:hypothetical protein
MASKARTLPELKDLPNGSLSAEILNLGDDCWVHSPDSTHSSIYVSGNNREKVCY